MKRERFTGERYRPVVTIKKMKKGIPTVIEVSGNQYKLQHPDHIRGKQQINRKRG